MSRDKIDWGNLPTLIRKRADGATREKLADIRFHREKGKHKGRNHLTNQRRRQMAKARKERAEVTTEMTKGHFRNYMDQVRAYWRGEIEQHPKKPR